MCYNYEDLENRARDSWKHQHGEETVIGNPGEVLSMVESGERKDESIYPGRRGHIVLLGENTVREGLYGLLRTWNKKVTDNKNTYNARTDSIKVKPTWRDLWHKKQRCIIQCTGFFETDRRTKKKYHFSVTGQQVFYLAGLYNWWTNPENQDKILTYAMLTTDPNDMVIDFHNRMPVIVDQDNRLNYMQENSGLDELLENLHQPYPAHLMSMEEVLVQPRTKKKKKDDPQGLLPF